ncbi:hypothetical protein HO173_008300 [Letharia columbiana]|uniref:Uncharacterized protein n=1 Tax=Letharia columbiana TaxID=112416 RepID=A0A8H6L2S7_9LECA|nr:uncharacterized protein HO173_008300 [Letharia columbiana]KAF6233368.1 hypothetical protein HO173_008300 [Letharia columbiana]
MTPSHPSTQIKTPWRWLTTKTQKKNSDNNNNNNNKKRATATPQPTSTKRNSFTNHTILPKPQAAVHRLQELKSPPPNPIPQSQSSSGPDGLGFKSRPLYRRTRSCPATTAEDDGTTGGARGGKMARAEAVVGEVGEASGAGRAGLKGEGGGWRMDFARGRAGEGGGDAGGGGGGGGSGGGGEDSRAGRGGSSGGGCG